MTVTFMSDKGYTDKAANHGDCILIDTGSELVIYDCGCQEHAKRVLDYMKKKRYKTADFILSHNDSDHFDGLPHLIEAGVISRVYTLLLLKEKYREKLLQFMGNYIKDETLIERIKTEYNNIYSLEGSVSLEDALELPNVCNGVSIIGPELDAALEAVSKHLDNREGNTLDGETIHNAICFQAKITMDDGKHMLLSGDSAFSMVEPNLKSASHIQLPHHGKYEIAEKIFEHKDNAKHIGTKYYVSDNTGSTNGGSDTLKTKDYGRDVSYTAARDIVIEGKSTSPYVTGKSYGVLIR